MASPDAERAAARVGLITLILGGALAAAPDRLGRLVGFSDPRASRVVGVADLALVPGLLRGRPRWPWMAGRIGLNLAIVGYLLASGSQVRRSRLTAAGLLVATATDVPITRTLRSREHPSRR